MFLFLGNWWRTFARWVTNRRILPRCKHIEEGRMTCSPLLLSSFFCHHVGKESVHKCSGVKTRFKSRYMPIEVVSGYDTLKWKLKCHMRSNQPNNQPRTPSTIQTNCKKKKIAQPAKQHISETTYRRNIYKLNNPRLSQLYILIYQMTSNVIRLAMIGYQPTIKNHQNQG